MSEQYLEILEAEGLERPTTKWGASEPWLPNWLHRLLCRYRVAKARQQGIPPSALLPFKQCPKCKYIHALTATLCMCGTKLPVHHTAGDITLDGFQRPRYIHPGGSLMNNSPLIKWWLASKTLWWALLGITVAALQEWTNLLPADSHMKSFLLEVFALVTLFLRIGGTDSKLVTLKTLEKNGKS